MDEETERCTLKADILEIIKENSILCPRVYMVNLLSDETLTIEQLRYIQQVCNSCTFDDILNGIGRNDQMEEDEDEDIYNDEDNFLLGFNQEEDKGIDRDRHLFQQYNYNNTYNNYQPPVVVQQKPKTHNLQIRNVEVKKAARIKPKTVYTTKQKMEKLREMISVVGKPQFEFSSLKSLWSSNTALFDNFLYRSWQIKKKNRLEKKMFEPRMKYYWYELYQEKAPYATYNDECDEYYFYDRLDDFDMARFKENGTIHKDFVYDHPFWYSKSPIPDFLQKMSPYQLSIYMQWKRRDSNDIFKLNGFDKEPRKWDGTKNVRLSASELSTYATLGYIHPEFVYDVEVWKSERRPSTFTINSQYRYFKPTHGNS